MGGASDAPREGFWDSAYRRGEHLEHWEPEQPPAELAAAVAAGLLPPGGTALDVGCGAGCEALYLASLGFEVVGVDASTEALAIARRRSEEAGLSIDWRLGDVADLPVASETVDLVIDRGCLHVVDRARRGAYAAEVARVLRPGGVLFLRGARRDDDEGGVVGVGEREARRLFAAGGLSCGPVAPFTLRARSGNLDANLIVATKPRSSR